MTASRRVATAARVALGGIRVVNGALALLAPQVIIGRFGGDDPRDNPAATYALRLFGIRAVLLGLDLLRLRGRDLDHALKVAPLIHAGDTATVWALRGAQQIAPERARPLLLISGTNTLLAVVAYLGGRRR